MPQFILLTKLAPEIMGNAVDRRSRGKAWKEKVQRLCPNVKWIAHYAILGPYDFMDIYEAPDAETAQKISLISRAEGALSVESWQALPYENYLKILEEIR